MGATSFGALSALGPGRCPTQPRASPSKQQQQLPPARSRSPEQPRLPPKTPNCSDHEKRRRCLCGRDRTRCGRDSAPRPFCRPQPQPYRGGGLPTAASLGCRRDGEPGMGAVMGWAGPHGHREHPERRCTWLPSTDWKSRPGTDADHLRSGVSTFPRRAVGPPVRVQWPWSLLCHPLLPPTRVAMRAPG